MKGGFKVQLWMLQAEAPAPLAQAPGPVDYAGYNKLQILQDLSCYAPETEAPHGVQTTVLQ